jgi:hypothetical protein
MISLKKIILIYLLISSQVTFGQATIDRWIIELTRPQYYPNVLHSKKMLVDLGEQAIPELIELLKDTCFVKLTNTADLIYPGARKYYGHGRIVDYDIDWISVRAAWVLEEITFEDFGYKQNRITERKLFDLIKKNYDSEYIKSWSYKVNWRDSTDYKLLIAHRKELAIKVENWWSTNQNNWTRFKALKNALQSKNTNRQLNALNYLRFGKTQCAGLTQASYEKELKPLVQWIKRKGRSGSKAQAKLLLDNKNFY